MDKECPHFHALKFKNEPAGMCCASGKVQLPEIETPPEPGNYLYGKTTFAGTSEPWDTSLGQKGIVTKISGESTFMAI
ncbi:ATP-dependent DNA helicase [Aphis craccivora]|uniref:ATP-dependent DNA helicase n=1 Tax=Aphis craccivora TaxID=307492 RepID=A0A6G0Y3S6_APHCR|nr:ATP-dependent DNA helicase [Aphis craccivora]